MKFYDREEELKKLRQIRLLSSKTAQMTVITGRRRVGKTELIRKFLKESGKGIYFFVGRKKTPALLEEFTAILSEDFPTLVTPFRSFSEFFKFIFEIAKKQNLNIIFDEFQNFKFVDPSVFSTLQNFWDTHKTGSRLNLILVGSITTLMEKIFSGQEEPLFGRATQKIYLEPFPLSILRRILKDHQFKKSGDLLNFYTIFGGIPKYYECLEGELNINEEESFFELIRHLFLEKNSLLKNEGFDLLIEEFGKNYQTYFSLLQIIASGTTKMSEIAGKIGIPATALSRLLESLVYNFKILERRQPIFSKASKLGRYYLNDSFLTFWFRYIFRFRSLLEIGKETKLLEFIKKDLRNLQGLVFEKIAHHELLEKEKKGNFPFEVHGIGRFWDRIGHEIDLVAYNQEEKKIFFGECKLSASSIKEQVFFDLKTKASYLPWNKRERKEYYGLITIGKVKPEIKRKLLLQKVLIWEL